MLLALRDGTWVLLTSSYHVVLLRSQIFFCLYDNFLLSFSFINSICILVLINFGSIWFCCVLVGEGNRTNCSNNLISFESVVSNNIKFPLNKLNVTFAHFKTAVVLYPSSKHISTDKTVVTLVHVFEKAFSIKLKLFSQIVDLDFRISHSNQQLIKRSFPCLFV